MIEINIEDFLLEMNCIYNEEQYSVRDNGAVLRHSRKSKLLRQADDQWTFGKLNTKNGYLYIGSVRIHRIVATAFHGKPPSSEHVVDHIDTNRQNNRPENLRWLTRLENALLNPITVKRIESICGSIEAFLEDPSRLQDGKSNPNFDWMRRVSPQEAKACREKMLQWAGNDKESSGRGCLGEWIFKPSFSRKVISESSSQSGDLLAAKTLGAAQRKWRIPTEFPCCPRKGEGEPIAAYLAKLTSGVIFSRNELSISMVLESALADNDQSIYVICEKSEKEAVKPWSVAKVTVENDLFVHTRLCP